MAPNGEIGAAERRYLQAVYHLSGREAKSPVSVGDIKEHLGYGDDDAERCCDFWTACGALAWSNLGHVALTHVGLARAEQSMEGEAVRSAVFLALTHPRLPRHRRPGPSARAPVLRRVAKQPRQ